MIVVAMEGLDLNPIPITDVVLVSEGMELFKIEVADGGFRLALHRDLLKNRTITDLTGVLIHKVEPKSRPKSRPKKRGKK